MGQRINAIAEEKQETAGGLILQKLLLTQRSAMIKRNHLSGKFALVNGGDNAAHFFW